MSHGVYCIRLIVISSAGSETIFEQRVRYIFLQLVNKDSFCFTIKEWGVTIMEKEQTPSHPIFILGLFEILLLQLLSVPNTV